MGAELVEYTAVTVTGKRNQVRGHQIGYFAVRELALDERGFGHGATNLPYVIDHIPTGIVLADWPDRVGAWALADEVSRFALHDAVGPSPRELLAQLGPPLVAWVQWLQSALPRPDTLDFRAWLIAQDVNVKPNPARGAPL